jgi:hypothetical protein
MEGAMHLKSMFLSLALVGSIAVPASANSLRRVNVVDSDSWSFIATHFSTGANNQQFVNDIPMGPYATEAACVGVMKAYQPDQPPPNSDFVPWDGIFKTSCCVDNITGAKDCGTN